MASLRALPHALCAAALLMAAAAPTTFAQTRPAASRADGPARVIVRFKSGSAVAKAQAQALKPDHPRQAKALAARAGVAMEDGLAIDGRTQVVKASGLTSAALAARLAADPDVEFAEVDGRAHALAAPNDPRYPNGLSVTPAAGQWYLRPPDATFVSAINAETAWDLTTGSGSVVVALLDTGVRFGHPDLAGKLLAGYDFISDVPTANDGNGRDADASDPGDWVTFADTQTRDFENCDVADSLWHGTQTAGLIGAATNNGIGMAGVGRNVKVVPVRVLGKCGGFDSDIQAGMRWAAGLAVPGVPANPKPARVLNMSLGSDGTCTRGYQTAVDDVMAAGAVVVAAAGNSALAAGKPANCTGAIGVAGLRHSGTKVSYSSLGSTVSIAAPAGNCVSDAGTCLYPLLTTSNSGTTTPASNIYTNGSNTTLGTSFASPLVAGTVGLMLSIRPALNVAQITRILTSTAAPFPTSGGTAGTTACQSTSSVREQFYECYCTTGTCGAGMLDAAGAVSLAKTLVFAATASFTASPANPSEGDTITLDAGASIGAADAEVASYRWSINSGDAIAQLTKTSGVRTQVKTSGAGSFSVRLTITDTAGKTASTTKAITVEANDVAGNDGSSGGGASSPAWLMLLAAAIGLLATDRRSAARPRRSRD